MGCNDSFILISEDCVKQAAEIVKDLFGDKVALFTNSKEFFR